MNEGPKRRWIIAGAVLLIVCWAIAVSVAMSHAQTGTLQPWRITVPRYEAGCGPCADTLDAFTCEQDTNRVTVIVEADGGWRRFYRQYDFVARDSVLAVNDWKLPVGWWRCRTLAHEPGQESCWSEPFGRVSRMAAW